MTSVGPCWCGPQSSQTYEHRCVWRVQRVHYLLVCRSYSSRKSRLKWLIFCDRASAPSAAAPRLKACRSVLGECHPSATGKHTPTLTSKRRAFALICSSSAGTTLTYRDTTRVFIAFWADLNVAQMQDGGNNFEDIVLSAVLYSWGKETDSNHRATDFNTLSFKTLFFWEHLGLLCVQGRF